MLPYHSFSKIMRIGLRIFLVFCVILLISEIALAEDSDVIIGFHQRVGLPEKALINDHGGVVKKSFRLIPAVAARIPENKIEEMKKDPGIAYIEIERIYKAADEYSNSWGVQHISAQTIHGQGIYGDGVKIAVLDTGIDYNHPDLSLNYKGGYDFVYNDPDPIDYNGHGTHVSGIIAAKNNGVGVVGVAPNSSIYAVSVLSPYGDGLTSWIISGIEWAVENNMTIATMSFNCDPNPYYECDDPALHDAIDNAYNSGLLLVASGGNTNGGEVLYPAAYDSVIAVTATDQNDKSASFDPSGSKIELAAPGVNILSTVPTGTCAMCDPSGYRYASGTSMAAPHVTGVAALVFSSGLKDVNQDGKKDNKDVRLILQNTARDLGDQGRDNIYGYGVVDASRAVKGINDIELLIKKTNGRPDSNEQKISLSTGNYSITIRNKNLSRLVMEVFENGVIRKDISAKFKLNESEEMNIFVDVRNVLDFVFIPYGSNGATGYVTIRSNI